MATEQTPVLDDVARMQSVDRRGMLRLITELPEQYETAMGLARSLQVQPLSEPPNVVLVTGIGDGALAADMAAAALADELRVPIIADHGGRLPKCLSEQSVVFVVDFSGQSQIALRNYKDARSAGAQVICVTTGGALRDAAVADSCPVVRIPPGQPRRTAIGYLFAPLVVTIEKLGLTEGASEKLSSAVKLLKNIREYFRFENPTARNAAKQAALELFQKVPCVYGAVGYRAAVAARWKSLINTNAKMMAIQGAYPDVAESEVTGWESVDSQRVPFALVLLKDLRDKADINEMMDLTREVLESVPTVEVDMKGATVFEKMLYGFYMGDYVSHYLALLNDVDPTRTEYLAYLQSRLAGAPKPEDAEPTE